MEVIAWFIDFILDLEEDPTQLGGLITEVWVYAIPLPNHCLRNWGPT